MKRKKTLLALSVILLSLASCTDKDVKQALVRLDRNLQNSSIWRERFDIWADSVSMKCRNPELDLHQRWKAADTLNLAFRHYQSDSSYKYLRLMHEYARSDREIFMTGLSEIRMHLTMCDVWAAYEKFRNTDTTLMAGDTVMVKEYLATGMAVCHNFARKCEDSSEKMFFLDRLSRMRSRFISISPKSMEGKRYKAQYFRDIGEWNKAIEIFEGLYRSGDKPHNMASFAYNLATIYKSTGDRKSAMIWLAKAVEYDFRTPDRDYMSLYDLAVMCYEDGMLSRAQKYVRINLEDIVSGNIHSRIFNSSQAEIVLSDAEKQDRQITIAIITAGLVIILILSAVLFVLLRHSNRTNQKLKESNISLNDSNAIKDSYVFRYMSLSIEYLERMVDIRKRLRQTAKKEGIEAMMSQLKSPEEMYDEYDRFYRIFDETFLGLYPDFVQKVNSLLREECRFPETSGNTLNTELRILAAIRIGITQSGRIATFLKCSPATVYTYRTKLRNSAICKKTEFESQIKKL